MAASSATSAENDSGSRNQAADPRRRARRYHLLILGAGSAGLAAASLAGASGARIALVGRWPFGGVRRRQGDPLAEFVRASRSGHDFATALGEAQKQLSAKSLEQEVSRLESLGVDVFRGQGRFVAGDALEVDGQRLRFRRAVIATGARLASAPPTDAAELAHSFLDLPSQPESLAILGSGARACELATAFAALGSRVELIAPTATLLPGWESDAAALVAESLRRRGIGLHFDTEIRQLRQRDNKTTIDLDSSQLRVDAVLGTEPRQPNVRDLGLEAAGVEYELDGIDVDSRCRTSRRNFFAIGDVVAPMGEGPAAEAEARTAVRNALFFRLQRRPPGTVQRILTEPEVARVGSTEARRSKISTVTVPLADLAPDGDHFLRLWLRRRNGKIVGALLVAARASERIVPLALAIERGLTVAKLAESLPSFSAEAEVYLRAARLWHRKTRWPLAGSLLDLWFRLT